jgi:hypothetical protein
MPKPNQQEFPKMIQYELKVQEYFYIFTILKAQNEMGGKGCSSLRQIGSR